MPEIQTKGEQIMTTHRLGDIILKMTNEMMCPGPTGKFQIHEIGPPSQDCLDARDAMLKRSLRIEGKSQTRQENEPLKDQKILEELDHQGTNVKGEFP